MLSTEAVGLFSIATSLISHTVSLLPLSTIIAPVIPQYVHQRERFYRIINKAIKYQIIGFTVVGIVAFFVFPPIIISLFPNYAASVPLFKVMLLVLIPLSFAVIFTPTFFALKKQKSLFFATILQTTLILIFAPLFISVFGIMGIVYEFILTTALFVVERYILLRKLLPDLHLSLKNFITIDAEDYVILNKIVRFVRVRLRKQKQSEL